MILSRALNRDPDLALDCISVLWIDTFHDDWSYLDVLHRNPVRVAEVFRQWASDPEMLTGLARDLGLVEDDDGDR